MLIPSLLIGSKTFQLMGPIVAGSTEAHRCYASRVFFNVFQAPNDGKTGMHCLENCMSQDIGVRINDCDPANVPAHFRNVQSFANMNSQQSASMPVMTPAPFFSTFSTSSSGPSTSFQPSTPDAMVSPLFHSGTPLPRANIMLLPIPFSTPEILPTSDEYPGSLVCLFVCYSLHTYFLLVFFVDFSDICIALHTGHSKTTHT